MDNRVVAARLLAVAAPTRLPTARPSPYPQTLRLGVRPHAQSEKFSVAIDSGGTRAGSLVTARASGGAAHISVPAPQLSIMHMFPQRRGETCNRRCLRRWRVRSPDTAHARASGARVTAAQQRRYVAPCRRCRKRSVRVGLDSAAGSGTEPTVGGTDGNVGTGAERSAGVLRRSARKSGDATARRGAASRWTAKPAPARWEVLR